MFKTIKNLTQKLSKRTSRILVGVSSVVLAAALVVGSIYYLQIRDQDDSSLTPSALAAFTSYEGGQVSLEVNFLDDQGREIPNIISLPSTDVTVRLKYANTGGLQATGASISSTLPTGFSYVPGTLRNVFDDTISVNLQDTRFSGQTLTVSPTAGLYGASDDEASGLLDIGKADYLRIQKCSLTGGDDELFAAATNDQTQASNNSVGNTCSTFVSGSFLSGLSIPLINQRYLKSIECQPTSGVNETFAQYSSNTPAASSSDSSGNICGTALPGSVFESVTDIDLTSGRYARVLRCDHPTNDDEFVLAPQLYDTGVANNDATGENCASAYAGSSFVSGNTIDLIDTTNSEGFIEFQMTTSTNDGCFDIAASLSSSDFSTITATNSCGIRIQSGSILSDGQTIFTKSYFNGLNNVNTTILPIGGQTKVRLNYDNSSTSIGYGLSITDSYDTTYFEYIPGTAVNCYESNDCVPLEDENFDEGSIAIGPNSGLFGYRSSGTTSPLETGRERYLHIVQCFNGTYYDTFVAESNSDEFTITGSCSDYGLAGYTKSASRTVGITGKRYLNMITCQNNGFYDTFVAEASNISGESALLCSDFGLTGYTNVSSFGVDLQASTELNLKTCEKSGVIDTYVSEASNTAGASTSGCFDSTTSGYTDTGGFGISTGNTNNGYGYIEYGLRARENVSLGTYGYTAAMSQAGVEVVGSSKVAAAQCPDGFTGPNANGLCEENVYIHITECWEDGDVDDTRSFILGIPGVNSANTTANKTPSFTPSCSTDKQLLHTASRSLLVTGNDYLNVVECWEDSPEDDTRSYIIGVPGLNFVNTGVSNSASITPVCNPSPGRTFIGTVSESFDIANNRYLHITECWEDSPEGDTRAFKLDSNFPTYGSKTTNFTANNDPNFVPVCSSPQRILTHTTSRTLDLRPNVAVFDVCPIGYNFVNASECELNGESISQVTADSSSTITIQLYCDSVVPVGGVRSITLSDAELRTDQDFTCNYNASICPVVYEDANLNSNKDDTENIYDGISVELRRSQDNSLVNTIVTDANAVGLQCFDNLASGVLYDVIVTNPPTSFSTTGEDIVSVESSVLVLQQPVYFGYSDGGVVIDSAPEVFFPSLTISPQDVLVSTVIPYVEVRDLRSATLPWTVTGVVTNFSGTVNPANTLSIDNRFTTIPQTVTVTSGESQIITKGSRYTVTNDVDSADIFNTGANDGSGQYSISVDIEYNVPSYSTNDSYQSTVTFTLI